MRHVAAQEDQSVQHDRREHGWRWPQHGSAPHAALVVSNLKMFLYFPILMFSGIASGIMIGIVAYVIDKKYQRVCLNRK